MLLSQLTVSGFKSFAKKSELEFSVPITAIVGPNGSGKSNIAEAFRFVLGEQSLRALRGRKGEDLIFNGTASVVRSNRASAGIVFDNTNKLFSLDVDQITIERTVHRDGQNEYCINGSRVRLKEVHELLAEANIGSTGHHIISQGEADRILTANAKARREMVEDALGLKVYQYKKADALKKLKKTKQNIEQVQSLRREVAPHKQYLERQLKKLERGIKLRAELQSTYLEYLKREDIYLAFHNDRLLKAKDVASKKLKEVTGQLSKIEKDLESIVDDERSALINSLNELEKEWRQIREEKQKYTLECGKKQGQIDFLNKRIADIAEINKDPKTGQAIEFSKVEGLVDKLSKDIEKAVSSDQVSVLRRALQDVAHTVGRFLESFRGSSVVSDESEKQAVSVAVKELEEMNKQVDKLVEREVKKEKEIKDIRDQIESRRDEKEQVRAKQLELVSLVQSHKRDLEKLEYEYSVIDRDRTEFKRELQEAVALLGRLVSLYYEHKIEVKGEAVSVEDIVEEDRTVQYERRRSLDKLKIRMEEVGGVDQSVEKEYKDVCERDDFLAREINDLERSVKKLETLIEELSTQLNEQFSLGIDKIGLEFNKFFALMFGGGQAGLRVIEISKKSGSDSIEMEGESLEEVPDETESGIEIDVQLPNKRVRGLEMLSGGERALTSIALIFAMSQVNPPPFIILDETDAALDEANSRRYGDMIEALSERSQLILITHNRETMSRAGVLYGVTMSGDGVSKLLSVKFDDAVAVAK